MGDAILFPRWIRCLSRASLILYILYLNVSGTGWTKIDFGLSANLAWALGDKATGLSLSKSEVTDGILSLEWSLDLSTLTGKVGGTDS